MCSTRQGGPTPDTGGVHTKWIVGRITRFFFAKKTGSKTHFLKKRAINLFLCQKRSCLHICAFDDPSKPYLSIVRTRFVEVMSIQTLILISLMPQFFTLVCLLVMGHGPGNSVQHRRANYNALHEFLNTNFRDATFRNLFTSTTGYASLLTILNQKCAGVGPKGDAVKLLENTTWFQHLLDDVLNHFQVPMPSSRPS